MNTLVFAVLTCICAGSELNCKHNTCGIVFATVDDSTIQSVIESWRDRKQSLGAINISFAQRELHPTGVSVSNGQVSSTEEPHDFTLQFKFVFEGSKYRMEQFGNPTANDNRDYVVISTYDGELATLFVPVSEANPEFPSGNVGPHKMSPLSRAWPLLPLFIFAVSDDANLVGFDENDLFLKTDEGILNGTQCIIAGVNGVNESEFFELWITPERGFTVDRINKYRSGRLVEQTTVKNKLLPDGDWFPFDWETVFFSSVDEAVLSTGRVTVSDVELNYDVTKSVFEIEFPVGTVVQDARPSEFVTAETAVFMYLQKKNGNQRRITWEERFADYELLTRTDSGEAIVSVGEVDTSTSGWPKWLVRGSLLIVIIFAMVLVNQFKRKRSFRSNFLGQNTKGVS